MKQEGYRKVVRGPQIFPNRNFLYKTTFNNIEEQKRTKKKTSSQGTEKSEKLYFTYGKTKKKLRVK